MKENKTQYPVDWNQVRIGDIAKVKGGKRLPYGFYVVDTPTPYPYLRVLDMYPGGVNQSDIKYVPEQAFPAIQNYRIYSEDIFISVAGSLGIVGVVPPELSGANLTENANYITDIQCDRDYLKYWLMSHPIQNAIKLIQTTGAQPKLALRRIAKFSVAIPQNIKEQRAIAEVLSDVDGLINALDALIAKKRAIKQATMQQLLTGKARLPGFSRVWETKRLGDLLAYKRPDAYIVKSTEYSEHGNIPVLTGNKAFILGYTDEVFGICQNFPAIIFDDFTTDNKYATFPFKVKSSAIKLLYPKHERVSLRFIFERMQLIDFPLGNHKRYYISEYQNLELPVPDYEEQRAIAAVLSDMDAEIAALEQRRDKTIAIKKGMMQQLLTGKVRLIKYSASKGKEDETKQPKINTT